jgi:threonine/homoserine/homoserine lactone efflux protein
MVVLGAVFFVLALACDIGYALAGAAMGGRLRRRVGHGRWQRPITCGVYLGLGVYAALSRS